jgi:hypothetical protein
MANAAAASNNNCFAPSCNCVVERGELVKGYKISKGQYVQLTEADLEQLEVAESQQTPTVLRDNRARPRHLVFVLALQGDSEMKRHWADQ